MIQAPLGPATDVSDVRSLYLDLIKRCVTNWIYADVEKVLNPVVPEKFWKRWLAALLKRQGIQMYWEARPANLKEREEGHDWPSTAHTMIGLKRLDNLQWCVEEVLRNDVPGDLIETGVWRGGASIFMRAVLKAYGVKDRRVWVADSFAGLPPPDTEKYPQDAGALYHTDAILAVSLERVQANFERYGLLDDQVRFLKGWFCDTLPTAPIEQLAILRLDGDMYGSTMDALNSLYPKLSVGGFVIVDDYAIPECQKAVQDFRNKHAITDEVMPIDWAGVYWQRTG